MVMITRMIGSASLRGLIARRSNKAPTAVVTTTAKIIAKGRESSRVIWNNKVSIPPSITNSPWAKLITSMARRIITSPIATRL
jgi:uncharacterized lipoprotein YbaY